jgi:predicted nucleotidyltransferase
MPVPDALPDPVRAALTTFATVAEQAFGDDLAALILFGSAAEGRLRPTSDVNLIVVLERCAPDKLAAIGDAYQLARTAIRLSAMFILEREIKAAGEAFAVKFADIAARHAVIYGRDVFAHLELSRGARLNRVRQVLMNLLLRLRERHVAEARFPERLAFVAADAVGPLRASAATLLLLRDGEEVAPREALIRLASQNGQDDALALINKARETGMVPEAGGAATLFAALDLTAALQDIASHLS